MKTDGWRGYRNLAELGYEHVVFKLSGSGQKAHRVFPGSHRVFSLLKRFLLGTYQGAVSRRDLPKYLGEFEFRFNRRSSQSRGLLFQRLLSAGVRDRPMTHDELVAEKGKGWPVNRWAA